MFLEKDIICFLGDSITANGRWMAEVYQILRQKYKIKCYNCGVGGGMAKYASQYIQSECLIYNPDYVVVMFGINDIRGSLYAKRNAKLPDLEQRKNEAINTCVEHYEEIMDQIVRSGAKPIICIPVPYDEITVSQEENLMCQCALDALETELRSLAEKYGCPLIDFKKTFLPLYGSEGIICSDRVHPTDKGQHIMAQTFLYNLGEIEAIDYSSEFVFEEWNKKRFDAEQKLHLTNFVEFAVLFCDGWLQEKTNEEKKAIAQSRYDEREDKTDIFARAYRSYIETIDNRSKLLGEVVRLTKF